MSSRSLDRYPLNQSPLFKLRGKGQFQSITGVNWDAVQLLLDSPGYRVWVSKKGRDIQQPIGRMDSVHRRIGELLARIELPSYLYSQKGRSYADNARQHVGSVPLIKTDIHKFYPSTTWAMVYRMFCSDFMCALDVSRRLADICCYEQKHLPTGSPLSGRVAFFAARHMFDDIAGLAQREECRVTVYVDDVTVSGEGASKSLLVEIRRVVHRHGLKTKNKKSRTYAATAPKMVTGAVVVGDELRLPNARHLKIKQARHDLQVAAPDRKERLQRVLCGRLQDAKQILR